jgi:ATP-dependent Clp protease adaptor protein ClpS
MSTKVVTKTRISPNLNLQEPPQYKVIYINDNVTTVDFVIESLITVFDYVLEDAVSLTQKIHEEGMGTAAILPYEMAEQKGVEVTQLARNNGFPLNIKLEPAE